MTKQSIKYEQYDWDIIVYYNINKSNKEYIINKLLNLNCTAQIINEVNLLITKLNKGFTYSNTNKHISFVCITDSTSNREFINSITHEAKHIMENICEAYNIPLKGEQSAYIIGEIVMNMFDVFKYLI